MFSYRFAKRHQVLLYRNTEEALVLSFVGNLSPVVLQEVHKQTPESFHLNAVNEDEFTHLLEQYYQGQDGNSEEAFQALSEEIDLEHYREQFSQAADLLETDDDAPIIKLINGILTESIKKRASDIHIESFEHRIAIRIRIDGVLQTLMNPPVELAPFLVSRVKVMAGLDIAEKRLPQDGRISTQIAGRSVDIRVSTLPVANAERVVMRILDKAASSFTLSDLALPQRLRSAISQLIHRPHGIFLVVGPTGSGKTTTLYASLSELDLQQKNIMTVEDPIEYFLDGISQTQVNSKAGMSFAKGLRAILRQDPDIIMVGEIRDLETAEMAVQASLTGHMVFSTLHTNTAIGAIMRLKDMGIEPFLLGSSLSGVLSQRLVRKLCEHCKMISSDNTISQRLLGDKQPHYKAIGCEKCNQLGYRGRVGIYELLSIDENLREMIFQGKSESEMQKYISQHQQNISTYGLELVRNGVTTLEEVMRVTAI